MCRLSEDKSGKVIDGLFGIGIGYSMSASDTNVQAEMRLGSKADAVSLYVKHLGNKLLP